MPRPAVPIIWGGAIAIAGGFVAAGRGVHQHVVSKRERDAVANDHENALEELDP